MEKDLEILNKFCEYEDAVVLVDNALFEYQNAVEHLIQAYKEQQAELEKKEHKYRDLELKYEQNLKFLKHFRKELNKKDKMIDEMSKIINIMMTDIKVVKSQFEKEYCDFINSNEECCWKTDSDCTDCIKKYFERKVEDVIK